MKRVPLLERLRIAKAAHVLALENAAANSQNASKPAPAAVLRAPAELYSPPPSIEKGPLHTCGCHMVRCGDCLEWHCRAPGHARHVCAAFSWAVP